MIFLIKMNKLKYLIASEQDIPFIMDVYNENIECLHGIHRDFETWKNLISDKNSVYYIVQADTPVAWFRIDITDDIIWLGMLQVKPEFQHQAIGRNILSFTEAFAETKNRRKIGIHTTEDNIAAKSLYESAGYTVAEIGKCTTADGIERTGYTFIKTI